jgi:hypothetical protein
MTLGDGDREPLSRLGDRVRRGDADGVEPLCRGQLLDELAQPLRLQKSSFS